RIDLRYNTISAEKMVALHNISMVNGLAKLNDRTLLLADSWAGNIVALDTVTKEYAVTFEHPSLKANFSSPISPPLGANGL
ncbi:hypothetical protein NQU36_28450, partial [Escherichia coli]|uniref:hypothetical protein n=1 Tax=Escherichia coli TaxID=562 RepID=UPI00211879FA